MAVLDLRPHVFLHMWYSNGFYLIHAPSTVVAWYEHAWKQLVRVFLSLLLIFSNMSIVRYWIASTHFMLIRMVYWLCLLCLLWRYVDLYSPHGSLYLSFINKLKVVPLLQMSNIASILLIPNSTLSFHVLC